MRYGKLIYFLLTFFFIINCNPSDYKPFSGPSSDSELFIKMWATDYSIPADGESSTTIFVKVFDKDNNPVSGKDVILNSSGGTLEIYGYDYEEQAFKKTEFPKTSPEGIIYGILTSDKQTKTVKILAMVEDIYSSIYITFL